MTESEYYRHFKGKVYRIVMEARDSTNCEEVIVYQGLYDDFPVWTRSKQEFFEDVVRDAYSGPRFKRITKEEAESITGLEL